MATILTDAFISLGGVDWSDNCTQVELPVEVEEIDTTAFTGSGWRDREGGLKNATLNATFDQSFTGGTGSLDAFIFARLGSAVAFIVRPTSTGAGTSNPQWSGTALCTGYTPISGAVGEKVTFSISWPVKTSVARATA